MNFNAATLTELVRTAQPDVLEGPDGHLDDADCELLLHRLLTASRDEEETTSRSGTRWRWLAAGGSLVGAAAAVLILALVAVGGHNPGPSSIHHDEPLPTQVQTVAEISANTSHAVLTAYHKLEFFKPRRRSPAPVEQQVRQRNRGRTCPIARPS